MYFAESTRVLAAEYAVAFRKAWPGIGQGRPGRAAGRPMPMAWWRHFRHKRTRWESVAVA